MNLDSIAGVTGVMPEESLPSRPLLIVLYGAPGVGKTTLSFTANNPILEDFDGGVERSDQALRPYVIKPQKYSGVKYLTEKVYPAQIPEYGYETIIIDTGQAMMDGLMTDWVIEQDDRFGTSSGLSRNGWGALGTEFKKRIAFLKSLGLNIIIIAHEKFEGEDEKATPDLKGQSKGFLFQQADMLGRVTVNRGHRQIDFRPSTKQEGKNTAGFTRPVLVPNSSSDDFPGFMQNLIERTQTKMSAQTKAQKAAEAVYNDKLLELKSTKTWQETEEFLAQCKTELAPAYYSHISNEGLKRIAQQFSQQNWSGLLTPEDFNGAAVDMKTIAEDRGKPFFFALWSELQKIAITQDIAWNKEVKAFEHVQVKESENINSSLPEDKPKKATAKKTKKAPEDKPKENE